MHRLTVRRSLLPQQRLGLPIAASKANRHGPFITTLVSFFLAEMGDKTQFSTIALGAKYASLTMVVVGTTLGMMAANIPAVLLGERLARFIPLAKMRFIAAALFAVFGSSSCSR